MLSPFPRGEVRRGLVEGEHHKHGPRACPAHPRGAAAAAAALQLKPCITELPLLRC